MVVDDPRQRTRALPSLYHGTAQIFVDRDENRVRDQLAKTINVVLASDTVPSYLITACRVADRYGLYTKDICNRSAFRRHAARTGLVMADDPYVQMTPDGKFRCEGWDPFDPEFVIVNRLSNLGLTARGLPSPSDENHNRSGFLTFLFGILRVGALEAAELRHLTRMIRSVQVVTEDEPERAIEAVRAG